MRRPRTEDRKIVALRPRAAGGVPADPARDDGVRGRVLLFTGVRWERYQDEAAFLAALGRSEPAGGETIGR